MITLESFYGGKRPMILAAAILAGVLAIAVACGGGETIKETVVVEKVVKETVVVKEQVPVKETVVVKEQVPVKETVVVVATATPAGPAAPVTLSGTLTVATNSVGVPVGTPELCVPGCGNEKYLMSAWDTMVTADPDAKVHPHIAESWKFSDDLTKLTWNIRKGIPFHQGYGELTAEDVAWTLNSVNGATNPDSVHDNAGDFSASYGETKVIDKYTAETTVTNFDSRAPMFLFSEFWQGVGISSKAVFDKFGKDGMVDVFIGTGPFEVEEWVDDSHISLKGVKDHWYKTPGVANVRLLEIPEEAVRIAMFESGEALITRVQLRNVPKLLLVGGKARDVGASGKTISFGAGNYLEKVNAKTGEPLDSPGFDPSLPWVGDPDAPGCDRSVLEVSVPKGPICDELENARKVRKALAISIDRDAINDALYNGLGTPNYMTHLSLNNPMHKDEWILPFDVEKAKQLLKEAGYGDGFEMQIYAGEGPQALEFPEAFSSAWQSDLGIKITYDRRAYATIRPSFVDRSNKVLVPGGWSTVWPPDWAQGREDNSWFAGGTMKYGALPFSAYTYGAMLKEPDLQKRNQLALDWYENENFWLWQPGIIEEPIFDIYNADKIEWNPQRRTSIWWGGVAVSFPLEDVVLK